VAEGVGVTAEDGDAVGALVGCAVPFGDAELAGGVGEAGLGVVVGRDVERTGMGEVEGCTVGLAGVPATVAVGGGGPTST